jgi:hypothetical protein
VPAYTLNIIDFLQSLPTGLLAAVAFVFVAFLLMAIKAQCDALVKYLDALEKRSRPVPGETLQEVHGALARIENALRELAAEVERLNKNNETKGKDAGRPDR